MKSAKRPYVMTKRAAKAEATKARIRASAMQLYCQRPIEEFTLEEVAQRAGTTAQTVLRAYGTKEKLVYAALEELAAGGVPLKPTPPGDVAAGIRALYDIYESIGDLVIQWLADERRLPAIKRTTDQGRENHRDGVRTMFAPQLAQRRGAARDALMSMLLVLTDVYVWKLLRRDQKLSRAVAEATVCRMITSITSREDTLGTHSVAELVRRR